MQMLNIIRSPTLRAMLHGDFNAAELIVFFERLDKTLSQKGIRRGSQGIMLEEEKCWGVLARKQLKTSSQYSLWCVRANAWETGLLL